MTGNIAAGACSQSWLDVLFWRGVARVIDGNDTTRPYYTLMPTAIPIGNAGGCGGGVRAWVPASSAATAE